MLNEFHPSTLICPITTDAQQELRYLRIHLAKGQLSDVLVDQIRVINTTRLISKLGRLTQGQQVKLKGNLRVIFDL